MGTLKPVYGSHDFPSLNDAIILDPWIVEAVLGSSKARWRGSREVLLWSHRPGEGPFFSGSMADGSFVRLVLFFGGFERLFGVFMSFPPFILTFWNLRYFLKVSKLNIFTNIVRIYNAKKRYNVMLFRSC